MKQLVLRIGTALYPLLTAFVLTGMPACGSVSHDVDDTTGDDMAGDDARGSDASGPDAPTPTPPPAGDLDKTFGTNGVLELPIQNARAVDIVAQDTKLVVCANEVTANGTIARIVRIDANGAVDETFGTAGSLTIASNTGDVSCKDLEVATDGLFVLTHYEGAVGDRMFHYDADGEQQTHLSIASASRLTALNAGLVMYGATTAQAAQAIVVKPDLTSTSLSSQDTEMTQTGRALELPTGQRAVITQFSGIPVQTTLVIESEAVNFMLDGASARVMAGGAAPDTVADAVLLPDGSVFAVGTADALTAVAMRWVNGPTLEGTVELHPAGTASRANSVALDNAKRPILVGTATVGGQQVFLWQRYEMSSVALDATYQIEGIATAVAPSGDGELVGITEMNGAMYALGTYDAESASPKIALLKIVE